MTRIRCAAAALVVLTAACSGADGSSPATNTTSAASTTDGGCIPTVEVSPRPESQSFPSGGIERRYLIAGPAERDGRTLAPVVVDLHGFTSTPEAQDEVTELSARGAAAGFVVVTPAALETDIGNGPQTLWNVFAAYDTSTTVPDVEQVEPPEGDDIAFIDSLLDRLEDDLCLDPAREFVTGMSNGAGMATWLVCQPGSRFAAAAYVAGINQTKACPADDVAPFIAFHGDADAPDPYEGGALVGIPLGLPPVEERAAEFALKQGCDEVPAERAVADDVVHLEWDCPDDGVAELYRVIGGSHSWPGSPDDVPGTTHSIDATALILDFFSSRP